MIYYSGEYRNKVGEAEIIFSDLLSKILDFKPDQKQKKIVKVLKISERNDKLLSEKLYVLGDFVKLPPFEKQDFISLLMSSFKDIDVRKKSGYFYIQTESKLHKILFSLWIEMLTGIDVKRKFGIEKDILFDVGANYRFPISSLEFMSTKNMIKCLSKSAYLLSTGLSLITENPESKAVALVLSVSVPKTKDFIVLKGSDEFLWRIKYIDSPYIK